MARVQIFEGGDIPRDAPNVVPLRAAQFDTGAIGQGMEQLGNAGQEAAGVLDRINAAHDESAAKEAANAVAQHFTEIGYTGANPYFDTQGKDALDLRPTVDKSLDSFIQQSRAGLTNGRQQTLFDDAITPQRLQWGQSIAAHALKETRTYAIGESKARQGVTGELGRLSYFDDPNEGEKQLDTQAAEIEAQGHLEGWGDDQIHAAQLTARSGAYKDIGGQLALSSGQTGVDLARQFVEQHKGSMLSDDRDAVLARATVQENAIQAEQRRAEAEARRQASEDKRDARDRVASAMGRIDEGVPLSPDEYASVIADAKATEDPNLIKRVQDGQFKNSLSIQYRTATPPQLQDRVNQLSADIAKAGQNADPHEIIERDHLQQMFNQSSSQLNADPLGWLARTQGVPVQQLNLDDDNSVQARVAAAVKIPAMTGHAPAVFTPSEVSALSPQWSSGNAAQKINLVTRLARFGPLATVAAQQIAPNDNGLVHLVSLASHSNKAAGLAYVTKALQGYDAIKTEGQIVGKLATQSQFNTFVGSALQFMPGARDGVFTVAKAMLAQDAAEHGWKDETDAGDKAWYRAINSALGAYGRGDGIQLGGLAGFNGAQTVLPENMGLDEFEGRISRASGPQFAAASNGVPVTGNGTVLRAGDLKKMHYVPVDDGIYRLESGGSFVHTKNGDPFQLDVRKLGGAGR